MACRDDGNGHGELPKPAKRPRKVNFSADTALDPNSCISIRLVSCAEEMQSGVGPVPEFSPGFAERFFGEEGKIFGYKDLKVVVWLHVLSFHAYVEISHTQTAQEKKKQVTDLRKVFQEIFGAGLIEERDSFTQLLSSYNYFSTVLFQHAKRLAAWNKSESQTWNQVDDDTSDASKEILLVEDLTTPELMEWHARLTPLAQMFIEAATPIETKDPRWELFVCLERTASGPNLPWRLVGFCRVYKFFKYPDSTRLRVSQILVLPPYRGQRNGLHLLEGVYKTAVERDSFEVTMEEPSNELQVLRECMDVIQLLSFEPVRLDLRSALLRLRVGSNEPNGGVTSVQEWMPSSALTENVRQSLKICKLQFRYCWHVLTYLHVMHSGEDNMLRSFRSMFEWSLKQEVFGSSKSSDVDKNKVLVDVENEHDSSRSFVMFKVKPPLNNAVIKDDDIKGVVDVDDPEPNTEDAYLELLKEREDELQQVAEKVMRLLKTVRTTLVQL